jgi:hypothetical protein
METCKSQANPRKRAEKFVLLADRYKAFGQALTIITNILTEMSFLSIAKWPGLGEKILIPGPSPVLKCAKLKKGALWWTCRLACLIKNSPFFKASFGALEKGRG